MKFADFKFSFGSLPVRPIKDITIDSHLLSSLVCTGCTFTCPRMYWSVCNHVYCQRCVQRINSPSAGGDNGLLETFCFECFKQRSSILVDIHEDLVSMLPCICVACDKIKRLSEFRDHTGQCQSLLFHNDPENIDKVRKAYANGTSVKKENLHNSVIELQKQVATLTTTLATRHNELITAASAAESNEPESTFEGAWTGEYVVKLTRCEGFHHGYTSTDLVIAGATCWFVLCSEFIFLVVKKVSKPKKLIKGSIEVLDLGKDGDKKRRFEYMVRDGSGALFPGSSVWFGRAHNIDNPPNLIRIKVQLE